MSGEMQTLTTDALALMSICPKCQYPKSKVVQALIKGGRRPDWGGCTQASRICECGMAESEMEIMGPPDKVIAQMIMECKLDWWDIKSIRGLQLGGVRYAIAEEER